MTQSCFPTDFPSSPKRLQINWTVWGCSLHSPGSTACDSLSAAPVEQAQNMNGAKRPQMLLTPEEEVAGELGHATGV